MDEKEAFFKTSNMQDLLVLNETYKVVPYFFYKNISSFFFFSFYLSRISSPMRPLPALRLGRKDVAQ